MFGRKPLPPYGRQYLALHPDYGLTIAVGTGAWAFAGRARCGRVLVLPDDRAPVDFRWPSNGGPALIHEFGNPDDDRIAALAQALLSSGASSVVVLRHSLARSGDPRIFFEPVAYGE